MVWIPFFHFKAEFLKESNSHSNQLLKKMKQNLTCFCAYHEEQYGYLVLRKNAITKEKEIKDNSVVYSYYFGINDKAFTDIDNQFL